MLAPSISATVSRASQADVIVIGAGVAGLAVARSLALAGRAVAVVDGASHIGDGQSSRNSEVIHAGIYYRPGSLKALTCTAGRERLYAYARAKGIPHWRIGKLIVATSDDETAALEALAARGVENGVPGLELIDGATVRRVEPDLRAAAALRSPETGIIDSHALMLALQADLEAAGGAVVLHAPVARIEAGPERIELVLAGGEVVAAVGVVVAAGLGAEGLLERSGLLGQRQVRWVKGRYLAYAGKAPFGRLVYPVPGKLGLGVHFTLDLAGQGRFGPDALPVEHLDYAVEPDCVEPMAAAIRRYWPALDADRLAPSYAGIRAQPVDRDFLIEGPKDHGVAGLVTLRGIESPGLTACLAIADRAADLLG
ncbi:MAG: FAD-dependent oxidoreductase [Pseudomonadota bacterium]